MPFWEQIPEEPVKLPYSTQYIDDKVRELVRALEVTGQREDTIILFVSDHGEMLGNGAYIWVPSGRIRNGCPLGEYERGSHVSHLITLDRHQPTTGLVWR